jgi:acetylornithine deacetylase/succinyl-diaminopimelate desuccinylase-like protein
MGVQAAEKNYTTFRLDVRNPGGHSSLPVKENAIYDLAAALGRLSTFQFPPRLNEISRAYFARMAQVESGQLAADFRAVAGDPDRPDGGAVERLSRDPYYNALLRTTCVATMLKGGHAENALPQLAEALVNCRMAPGDSPEAVRGMLVKAVADPKVEITATRDVPPSPFSPLRPDVLNAIEMTVQSVWGGIPVIPLMETGASDGKWLRLAGIPTYGISSLFLDANDIRAHGRDERVPKQAFYDGARFNYELVKRLGRQSAEPTQALLPRQ